MGVLLCWLRVAGVKSEMLNFRGRNCLYCFSGRPVPVAEIARLYRFGVLEARVQEEDGEKVGRLGGKEGEGRNGGRKMAVSIFSYIRVTF